MVSEPGASARDAALREMLVEVADVGRRTDSARALGDAGPSRTGAPRPPHEPRALIATVIVLVLVVLASIGALQLVPLLHGAPPAGSASTRPTPADMQRIATSGRLLGVWTSDDPAPVHKPFATHGLALAVIIHCSGTGDLFVSVAHDGDSSGACGDGSMVGNKAARSPSYLTVKATGHLTWSVMIRGVPETYVTPRPVTTALAADGSAVPFCTLDHLAVTHGIRTITDAVPDRKTEQLTFTNTGTSRCALAGYPRLQFIAAGRPVGHPANALIDEKSSMEKGLRAVVLQPRGHAYVQMGASPPSQVDLPCRPTSTTTLRISLANRLAGSGQSGTLDIQVPKVAACTNPKALQLFGSIFVAYGLPR